MAFIVKQLADEDLDLLFYSQGPRALVLNDLPYETEEEREHLNKLIFTTYEGNDPLPAIPTCMCGSSKGGAKLGVTCPKCRTKVERPVENDINFDVWVRCPEGVHGFIQPKAWIQLTTKLSPGKFNLLEWLVNPYLPVPQGTSQVTLTRMQILERAGFKRGLNFFIENIDRFIDLLPDLKIKDWEELQLQLKIAKPYLFPKHLPFPSKNILVLEKVNGGFFTELPMMKVVDAARTIATYANRDRNPSQPALERLAVSVVRNISWYAAETMKTAFRRKKGWFRGHTFSSRACFSARGVITSLHRPHYYETLEVPWEVATEILKYHLINKLTKHFSYTGEEAYAFVEANGRTYNPILDMLLTEIENECTGYHVILKEIRDRFETRGFPVQWQRNPTLPRNSSQHLRMRHKKDTRDQTFSMSQQCVNGANADNDGDEMNLQLIPDLHVQSRAQYLRPHYAIHELTQPGKLNNSAALPDVANTTISHFITRSLLRESMEL